MRGSIVMLALFSLTASPALAQDPVVVDSTHYSVVMGNPQVRVLRITYGPHEQSVMHWHPDAVAIFLTDAHFRFTLPDGTTRDREGKAGDVLWTPAEMHLPENVGDAEARVILVEMKPVKAVRVAAPAKRR